MDLEEQTLRYCLKLFSYFLILSIFLFLIFILFFEKGKLDNDFIIIYKGQSVSSIVNTIFIKESHLKKNFVYKNFFILSNLFYSPIHHGKFIINNNTSLIKIIKTISETSNYNYKITIIEGWEKYNLSEYLEEIYEKSSFISYEDLMADTYLINSSNSSQDLKKFLIHKKNNFFDKYKENKILKKYGIKKIQIIASLVEKEAKNYNDKKFVASVILNRLDIGMKLQIDASTIFAITGGNYKLNRKLTSKDLKINHPYNTYYIKGLPPGMISYISPDTIKIILENHKSNFLFYFYNMLIEKHIYSKGYNEHRKKLNDYRKQL